ncbi:zinc-binding alcohol dehydrogenase [Mycobacterium sp. DBP42]|jgi:threonine dehydrogenase-like Zn-dependent dehydrogenase|uniref:zinc-binding dehydrogenase n=1 Tax=Mycobacterium sp. DBP42 TaxID=2545267 RepID=UPI00110CEC3F|nr:zinc-binding alcohol dehydrogenase [Mycobacterium sp. DBP42]TMS52458.1 zinc-binding dehydrogenase [Mycobacterium sp. DBP42]
MAEALWFTAPKTVELRSEPVPAPAAGQICVRALCGLVSAGTEMNMYRGQGNLPDIGLIPNAEGSLPFPVKFGYQEVGEIEAVGPGSQFAVGDRVFCMHPHQSRFTLAEQFAFRIPPDLPSQKAVFAGLFWVGLNTVITTPPLVGDCVVVSGLGVVGSMAAYLANLTAASLVLIDPNAERRRRAAWIGADAVVHPDEASAAVAEFSGNRGADLFIEASGAVSALQQALQLTGMEGTITVTSWYGTRPVELVLSPEFHLRNQRIVSTGPSMPSHLAPRWDMNRAREVSWRHLARLDVAEYLVSHRVPFSDAGEAYRLIDDHDTETLAVLLEHRS